MAGEEGTRGSSVSSSFQRYFFLSETILLDGFRQLKENNLVGMGQSERESKHGLFQAKTEKKTRHDGKPKKRSLKKREYRSSMTTL